MAIYWLINGELNLDTVDQISESEFFTLFGRHTSAVVDVRFKPNATSVYVARHESMAPSIILSDTAKYNQCSLFLDGKQCSLDSICAFVTALAVWLQRWYDDGKTFSDELIRTTSHELAVLYLEPVDYIIGINIGSPGGDVTWLSLRSHS